MDTPDTLAAAMLLAASKCVAGTTAVVAKGATNVKNEGRANALRSAPEHNARAPQTIGYDMQVRPLSIAAVIGYDKDQPGGALGNILEYGSRNSPPHRDLGRALDAEDSRFEEAIADMAVRLL